MFKEPVFRVHELHLPSSSFFTLAGVLQSRHISLLYDQSRALFCSISPAQLFSFLLLCCDILASSAFLIPPALFPCSFASRSFWLLLSSLFSFPSFLFLFSLALSRVCIFNALSSIQMPSLLAECSADYCLSVSRLFLFRSSIVCVLPLYDRCDACSRFAPPEIANLFL